MSFYLAPVLGLLAALAIACSGGSEAPDASPTAATAAAAATESTAAPTATGQPSATAEPAATAAPTHAPAPTATNAPQPQPTSPPAPTSQPAPTSPPAPAGIAAAIKGYGFPYQLTVPAGSTVVWTNYDSVPHDVTASDDSWTSGLLSEGQSWSKTFNTPGKYPYVCRVHPYMKAVLIVE